MFFQLRDNIERLFKRMVKDGKATLRFKDPQIDLQISDASSVDLTRLLNATKMASAGESLLGKP